MMILKKGITTAKPTMGTRFIMLRDILHPQLDQIK